MDKVYVFKSGDCICEVAKKYNTTVQELCRINNISNIMDIHPGDKIKLKG